MRRTLFLGVLIVVVVGGWLFIDADSRARDDIARIWDDFTTFITGGEDAVPNWGDVAAKVGDFADEERALREVLDPALAEAEPDAEEKLMPQPEETPEPEAPADEEPRG